MARVTDHYGIAGPVEFLDVELSKDNRLFLDPRAIRLQRGRFATQANLCTETFFDEITACIRLGTPSADQRGLELLQRFSEPKETRLGLSKNGIDGHGGSNDVGRAIWDALRTDLQAFLVVGILKYIEDLPVFVADVAEDRTSDVTTRIVFEPLARFTQAMVAKHPEFTSGGHATSTFRRQIWDPKARRWAEKDLVLPVAADKPLVLVPRDWARTNLLMSSGRFFETTMLTFAQEKRTVIDKSTGKELTPPKRVLKAEAAFARGVETLIRMTEEAQVDGVDLVERFREFVDRRYEPLPDERIAERTR